MLGENELLFGFVKSLIEVIGENDYFREVSVLFLGEGDRERNLLKVSDRY